MAAAEAQGPDSEGADFKAGTNAEAQLEHPASYDDPELAYDMASASNAMRSRAALERGVVETVKDHDEASEALYSDFRSKEDEDTDYAARQVAEQAAEEDLTQKSEEKLVGLKERYNPSPYDRRIGSLRNEASDVHEGERAIERGGLPHVSTPQGAERVADREAEQLESWAESIHSHPEAAGEITAQQALNAERWLDDSERTVSMLEGDLSQLRERNQVGDLRPNHLQEAFTDVFGFEGDTEKQSPKQKAFMELLSKDDTTIGDIKEHVFGALQSNIDGWNKQIDNTRQKLAAIRGEAV